VAARKIPKAVRNFVLRYMPSVEHLETLMVLLRNTTRSWSAADVAGELGIAESTAADVLERLASDNFLDVKISNEILYRFNPATAVLEQAAAACSDLYRRERIAMINIVTAAPVSPMRDFAEAFRLTKGRRNG
jgi:DNA-binding IclR family transcriptional regulator